MIRAHRRQRGLALVTAMLVVAIVGTLATYLGLSQQVWLRQAQNINDLAQADGVSRGAIRYAAILLQREAKNNDIDALNDDWNQKITLPVEGGFVTMQVVDAQSRFNLNNLLANNSPSVADIGTFQNLLVNQKLDPSLKDALVHWLHDGTVPQPVGANDQDYLSHDPPYRAAHQPLASIDELRRVKGFTDEAVTKLRPFVVVLPARTAVNVNTADAEVLAALANVPPSSVEPIIALRKATPFTDPSQFSQQLHLPKPVPADVKTRFFIVSVEARIGRTVRRIEALVERAPAGQLPLVHWQQQTPLEIRRDEAKT